LVYRILRSAKTALSDAQITEKIAKRLGVDRHILARASFLDPKDPRLFRLHDGTFTLREDLEEVIAKLRVNERELNDSLSRANEENRELKGELASTVAQYEANKQGAYLENAKSQQLERERDEARQVATRWLAEHTQFKQVLSRFLKLVISKIGTPVFQSMIETLRQELEATSTEEEVK
jgi:hypothetical protein